MRVHVTTNLPEWEDATAELLASDPVAHTLPLSIVAALRAGHSFGADPPWFAWVTEDKLVVGAALRTPPYLLAITDMPTEAARALGAVIGEDVPGVLARADLAAVVGVAAGRQAQVRMRELQYRLDEPPPVPAVPGEARPATANDEDVVVGWTEAFAADAGLYVQGDARAAFRRRRDRRDGLLLWCVDGAAVSMAGSVAPVHGVPRIGPVYTPPEQRGRGYGAAATAAICSQAFADGAIACTLYADAANPASNAVYTRLGFHVVREVVEAVFDDSAAGVAG